ncbi:NADPH-dependent F420 reductase [Nonomuraea sp. NPDC050691]|uniref:NADPH-dependent F420 reductase n=1 Tax=Nonomuraea sp. NPDC050691 TaxID=3155661 RepID=UPI0033DAB6C6
MSLHVGVIGAGQIGGTVATLLTAAGYTVLLSNSRAPETLRAQVEALGPLARAGSPAEAVEFGDVVFVAIPFARYRSLPRSGWQGRVLVDTTNYFPGRRSSATEGSTSSEVLAAFVPKAKVVKTFNTLNYRYLREEGRPAGTPGRFALPLAGDHIDAKATVAGLIDATGFDPVDTGSLAEGGPLQQPESPIFNRPMTAERLRAALGIPS